MLKTDTIYIWVSLLKSERKMGENRGFTVGPYSLHVSIGWPPVHTQDAGLQLVQRWTNGRCVGPK